MVGLRSPASADVVRAVRLHRTFIMKRLLSRNHNSAWERTDWRYAARHRRGELNSLPARPVVLQFL